MGPNDPDRTPVDIWQPGIIIALVAELPGDRPGYRRPWMVLAVDWSDGFVLICPLFTHRQTGLAFLPRNQRRWYMPLAFTSHTLRFVRTNQYRGVQRQYGRDLPWPDNDTDSFSRYDPVVVEHAYARSYLHATSMLAPGHAQAFLFSSISEPSAVGRVGYHDFVRVMEQVAALTDWRPNAPAVPWL